MNLLLPFQIISIFLLVIPPATAQTLNYRCNCGEIGTYYNPIYVFRQVMGKYRTCWSPLFFNSYSHWNDQTFPDRLDFSTAFQCRDKRHDLQIILTNDSGAFTLDERYFASQAILKTSDGLEVSERTFPYFQANSYFNCQNIPVGKNINYTNPGPYAFQRMTYSDPCYKQTPIDVRIEVETATDHSVCVSKAWWFDEFDLLRSIHIFEFCKTPRVLAMEVVFGNDATGPGRLSSGLTVTYECDYGVEYTFKIEHRVSDTPSTDQICRNNKVDVDPLFGAFSYIKGITSCKDVYNFFVRKILE